MGDPTVRKMAAPGLAFVTSYPHNHDGWSNHHAGLCRPTTSCRGGVGYFYPYAGTGYGYDRMGAQQVNAFGPNLEGLRTWQESEARAIKEAADYKEKKYQEVKNMYDDHIEAKRKAVEDEAIKNKMIYEQEREHVRRDLGSEPYSFGGADGYSYPGYTGYGARSGGALGYSSYPNKPAMGYGYDKNGNKSLGYPYRF